MKFEALTIKDIATALGLSTSTVSRALRDSYEISAETKRRVLEYAQKMNYHPNPIALSLKEKKSRSIGVIVCEIANSFFSQVINGIESIANERGYNVIIAQSRDSAKRELSDLQFLTSRSIDGLILSVAVNTKSDEFLKELHTRGFPIVFFDRVINEINTHKVIIDNYEGAFKATDHLLAKGYRTIGMLNNSSSLSISQERLKGYTDALKKYNITFNADLVQYCEHGGMIQTEVEQAFEHLWNGPQKPDAIFAASDKLTTGALRVVKSKRLNVPAEIALIGFSNTDITELLNPPLSVVKQPAFEMGKIATELILNQIESKKPVTAFQTKILSPEMHIRAST